MDRDAILKSLDISSKSSEPTLMEDALFPWRALIPSQEYEVPDVPDELLSRFHAQHGLYLPHCFIVDRKRGSDVHLVDLVISDICTSELIQYAVTGDQSGEAWVYANDSFEFDLPLPRGEYHGRRFSGVVPRRLLWDKPFTFSVVQPKNTLE